MTYEVITTVHIKYYKYEEFKMSPEVHLRHLNCHLILQLLISISTLQLSLITLNNIEGNSIISRTVYEGRSESNAAYLFPRKLHQIQRAQ